MSFTVKCDKCRSKEIVMYVNKEEKLAIECQKCRQREVLESYGDIEHYYS